MPLFAFSIQAVAASLGGVGLFIVTFLDSSFLSLPEAADLLLIWMIVQHKPRMVYYSTMATLGSIAGCFVLYVVTRKAGDAFIRRRFKAAADRPGVPAVPALRAAGAADSRAAAAAFARSRSSSCSRASSACRR